LRGRSAKAWHYRVHCTAAAAPASGGWVYDNEATPSRIILRLDECEQIREDIDGTMEIMLGCKTVVK
jgi:hypothetical protein